MSTNSKEKRDYRQDITDEIIRLIETGTAPWQRPWDSSQAARLTGRPYNAATKRAYSGCNALFLMIKGKVLSADNDPRWCTFLQAKEQGWKIKKGAKGTTVEVWKYDEKSKVKNEETGEDETVSIRLPKPIVFYHTVFHASQVEGIPAYVPSKREEGWTPIEAAEAILKNSGAVIKHDDAQAYYKPFTDEIHLPPKGTFPMPEKYYQTALHELSHWTGHETRLNRQILNRFGTASYAKEELRAEMASLYIAMETGIPFDPHNSASYQASWLEALKNDKHEIFRAAKDADRITDYVMAFAQVPELIEGESPEAQKKMLEIVQADVPAALLRLTARQEYILLAQGAYLLRQSPNDGKIARELLLRGHNKIKIIDAMNRHSPFACHLANYGKSLVEKAFTPEALASARAAKSPKVGA
jgi:antirestriction protein ArdC